MSLFDDLYKLFDAATLQKAMTQAGLKMGAAAEAQVSEYPPQSHAPLPVQHLRSSVVDGALFYSKFENQRQQGKVFSLIAGGEIPYRRTGRLGQSITSEVVNATASDVTVSIGTDVSYAPLVIGDPKTQQSPYHRGQTSEGFDFATQSAGQYTLGNWTPLQVDMARGEEAIMQAGYDALFSVLEKGI